MSKSKKLSLLIKKPICGIVLACCLTATYAQEKVYLVGSDASYPPYEFLDEKGQVIGVDIDLLTAASKAAQLEVKFLNTPWKSWTETLNDGSRDIWASGIAVKEDRKKLVTYTDSYATNSMVVFVRDDNINTRDVNTLQGMEGKTIAGMKGSFNLARAIEVLGDNNNCGGNTDSQQHIIATDSQFLAYMKLLRGEVDGAIGNSTVGRYLMKPYLAKSGIKIRSFSAYDDPTPVDLAFVVKKGNHNLADKINEGLSIIRENGEYDRIMNKWFGSSN